jgi:hypothetical protein
MPVPEHLTANIDSLNVEPLLSDWRWLVAGNYMPILMTALGDLFLRDEVGNIHFLDVTSGEFKQVAESQEDFDRLCSDREQRRAWFAGFLVMELRKIHGELAPGECFGCKIPLSLGGKLGASNFERTDIHAHYSVIGQLYRQTKHVPPGTKIDGISGEPRPEDTEPKSWWQRLRNWTG